MANHQLSSTPNNTSNLSVTLKDIHLPEEIHNYPIAYGWWLLGLLLVSILIYSLVKWRAHSKRNHYKNIALKNLKIGQSTSETLTILKFAAMQYFPRQQVAQLYGAGFQQFLMSALPLKFQDNFKTLSNDAFTCLYQNNEKTAHDPAFFEAAQLWIKQALPPKPMQVIVGEVVGEGAAQ